MLPFESSFIPPILFILLESGVLGQLLLICALWQLEERMPIMKWGFTAGTWPELVSSSPKPAEC